MTIDSAYWPEQRNNHGGTVYQFEFEIIDPAHIEIYAIDANDVYTLIDTNDYTVEIGTYITPISKGGRVTFADPMSAAVVAISIQRKTPVTDEQEFTTGQPFNAESFEFQCDKLTMMLQEVNASVCDCSAVGGSGGAIDPTPPPGYDPDAYLDELVRIVNLGSDGGVYILDESSPTGDPIDQSSFGNDLVNFSSVAGVNQTSFLDDGRKATNVSASAGYRLSKAMPLSGTFGLIHQSTSANALRVIDIDHGSNILSLTTGSLRTQVSYSSGTQYHTWGGSATGVLYLIYSISGSGTVISELIRNFVSEGQKTTTGTYSSAGSDDFRIGSTGGTGNSKCQYAFWSNRQFSASDIADLELAYQRSFSSYTP